MRPLQKCEARSSRPYRKSKVCLRLTGCAFAEPATAILPIFPVGLARNVTFQRSEQMVSAVTTAVQSILPGADVVVHPIPRVGRAENIFDRVRAVATRNNVNVHDVSVQDLRGRLHVEQHLELDENLSLKEAHDRVTLLESEIRRRGTRNPIDPYPY